jgi:hypothetical protein
VIYLSGAVLPELVGRPGVGFMLTMNKGNKVPEVGPWAADSGLFSQQGARVFDLDRYVRWLWERREDAGRCLFATAPDVVGDAAATWRRSAHVLPCIRALGFPAALVAQDGIEPEGIDWEAFDVLFVGGTTWFKLAEPTYELVAEAKRRGKHAHMGRVNGGTRFRAARLSAYDSVDGTILAKGPTVNWPRVAKWLREVEVQPTLWATT